MFIKIANISLVLIILIISQTKASSAVFQDTEKSESIRNLIKDTVNVINTNINKCSSVRNSICNNGNQNQTKQEQIKLIDYDFLKQLNENDPKISKSEIKFKNFYKSCLNKDKANIKEVLKNLEITKYTDGWPAFNDNWTGENFNWISAFGEMNKYEILTIFSVKTSRDYKNDTLYIYIHIRPDSWFFNLNEMQTYLSDYNLTEIIDDLPEIIEFNQNLTNFASQSTIKYENFSQFNDDITADFDSDKFYTSFLDESLKSIINSVSNVVVFAPTESFKQFCKFMNNTDKKLLANYIMLKMIFNDEFPWSKSCDFAENNFLVFNPIIAKLNTHKPIYEYYENLYLNSYAEVLKILNSSTSINKNEKYLNEIINDLKNNYEKYIQVLQTGKVLYSNEMVDSYFVNFDIKFDNFLQNFYNMKVIKREFSLNKNKIKELLEFYKAVSQINSNKYSLSADYLNEMLLKLLSIIYKSKSSSNSEYAVKVKKCSNESSLKNKNYSLDEIEAQIYFNEVLNLIIKAHKNFMSFNDYEEYKIENEILKEFDMSEEQFLITRLHYLTCNINVTPNPPLNMYNTELISNIFKCPDNDETIIWPSSQNCRVFNF